MLRLDDALTLSHAVPGGVSGHELDSAATAFRRGARGG